VPEDNLVETIGILLCAERGRATLSQAALAERAGVSQQRLSNIERGAVNASLATVQRIFASLGRQLRVEAVPLRSDMDIDIDRGLCVTAEIRAQEVDRHRLLFHALCDIPFVVTGRLAAFVQGAPMVGPAWIDIVITRRHLDELAVAMSRGRLLCRRWNPRANDWATVAPDPREPGSQRWHIGLSDTRFQLVDELPETIEVRVGERVLQVVPIAEIERDDPWLCRLMTRWRER
jgi:transcriptional regulator with XRE-family HTH domain